jgi:hypothetical protein
MKKHNKVVVNLNKVAHAELLWVTDNNGVRFERHAPLRPYVFSINGTMYSEKEFVFGTTTLLFDFAKTKGSIDIWYPELTLTFTKYHKLVYTGDKALSIWKEWCAKIFGGKGK